MRKLILTALLASAALGLGVTQGSAGGYGGHGGYGASHHHVQYGGGGYGGGGYGHQQHCYWERQRVRVWDEYNHRYNWVWRRVRICR